MNAYSDADVTELFFDPDFALTFTVTRTTKTRGQDGNTRTTTETFPDLWGVVDMDGSFTLRRMPAVELQEGEIAVYSTFLLVSGSGYDPAGSLGADIVTLDGARYEVNAAKVYRQWGTPFVIAKAKLMDLNPQQATA